MSAALDALLTRTQDLQTLIAALSDANVRNISRLASLVRAELAFLRSLVSPGRDQKDVTVPESFVASRVRSSNIPFFESVALVVDLLLTRLGRGTTVAVLQKIPFLDQSGSNAKVVVEVVLGDSNLPPIWIKVRAGTIKTARLETDYDSDDLEDEENSDSLASSLPNSNYCRTFRSYDTSTLRVSKQAQNLITAAVQTPQHFRTPKVVFCFIGHDADTELDAEDKYLVEALRLIGVHVVLGISNLNDWVLTAINGAAELSKDASSKTFETSNLLVTETLNLDLTTLISLISDTCHRFNTIPRAAFESVNALRIQADDEEKSPLLVELAKLFHHRKLVATHTAFHSLIRIATTIGGEDERYRAWLMFNKNTLDSDSREKLDTFISTVKEDTDAWEDWLSGLSICVIPDSPSSRFVALKNRGQADEALGGDRYKAMTLSNINCSVFGTSDEKVLTTVTANSGLVRSLEQRAKGISIYLHSPRSLMETRWKAMR
ncbi:hypothetical protein HDU83_001874 [Entophlyctis luteolus]|nr:hypothetical protein HDU83_001874 [Entophlyctis luteolus]